MNRYPLWRYLLLAFLIILGTLYALPNIYGEDPAIQISSTKASVDVLDINDKVSKILESQQIPYLSVTSQNKDLLIRFADTTLQLKAQDMIKGALSDDFVVAANLAPKTPKWLQTIGANPMKLGLDLRGGIHFLLDVDTNAMLKEQAAGDVRSMMVQLREAGIRYLDIQLSSMGEINLRFRDSKALEQGAVFLSQHFPDYFLQKNAADFALSATLNKTGLIQLQNYAVEQNMNTLQNRVNALGVSEAVVQRQGATQISVDLPGIQDTARAKEMIGKVATIRLQLVDVEHDPDIAARGIVPFGSQLYQYEGRPVLLKDAVILKGSSIVNASSIMDQNGRPAVSVRLNGQGVGLFNRVTGANVGKPMAVVYVETKMQTQLVDGKPVIRQQQIEQVISVATIEQALGNDFQITGLESVNYAQNLALLLRSGAYSAPVTFVEERLIGPSLGAANIHKGVMSTEIGSLLVIIFMLLYYRLFGVFANLALLLNIVFIVAILSILGATLTLAGIAGIVLTVGMAVDANVLINERIREELRNGMSPQASIHAGYERAFSTIVDANLTTLIIAVVLFALGTGSVQGFAVTLTIGLLTSMVTAIYFTRAVVNLVYGRRQVKKLSIGI